MAPRHARDFLVAALLFFGTAKAARIAVNVDELEQLKLNGGIHGIPNLTGSIHPHDPLDAEFAVHEAIQANKRANSHCRNSVTHSVVGHRSDCKCDEGSYVVGKSAACLQGQRRSHFSISEFQGQGCSCEDETYTLCSNMVKGSDLRNSEHPDMPCKCPVGSFVTGSSENCHSEEQVRKFDPHTKEGCHCHWNYDHLSNWRDHIEAFWHDLMVTRNPRGIEPRCQPFIEGSGRRGIVLLMHGATACAGWWYRVKEPLVADGWMVVATTHIGHGRAPEIVQGEHWNVTDYNQEMPVYGQAYIDYADEINKAMTKYKRDHPDKEMVIVGHSIGGAIAANMAIEEPDLWNRLLIMNPFFAPSLLPANLDRALVNAIMTVGMPAVNWLRSGEDLRWSEGCDAIRLQPNGGHGGMCQFTLLHLRAWFQLGDIVQQKIEAIGSEHGVFVGSVGRVIHGIGHRIWTALDGVKTTHSGVKAQFLVSIGDGAVENTNVHYFQRVFKKWAEGGTAFCALPEEFTHNWVCPVDFPWIDHWWLDASRVEGRITAIDHVTRFVRDGTSVPERGIVAESAGDDGLVGVGTCDVRRHR